MNNRIRLIAIAAAFVVGAATPTQAQNPATLLNVSYEHRARTLRRDQRRLHQVLQGKDRPRRDDQSVAQRLDAAGALDP